MDDAISKPELDWFGHEGTDEEARVCVRDGSDDEVELV